MREYLKTHFLNDTRTIRNQEAGVCCFRKMQVSTTREERIDAGDDHVQETNL
jgi:hypothetical protein